MTDKLEKSQDQKENPEETTKQTQNLSQGKPALPRFFWTKTIIVSLAIIAGAIFCYDKYFAQKVVVFDLQKYIIELNELALKKEINEQQYTERFKAIEAMINDLPKNYTLLVTVDTMVTVKNAKTIEPN